MKDKTSLAPLAYVAVTGKPGTDGKTGDGENRGRKTGDRRNVSALSGLAECEGLLPGVAL